MGVGAGGLVARFILEDCDVNPTKEVHVRNLLTVGTPNMGYADIITAGC
tara:strand:+ start:235 stop:381 length:147 start_codon:yes stop_codon:yes gene_type:complete